MLLERVVGYWNQRFTHLPIALAVARRKQLDPDGEVWQRVLEATGQPAAMGTQPIAPTPHPHGIEAQASLASSHGQGARRLQRGLVTCMACWPRCQPGIWRLVAAIIYCPVIRRRLNPLKLVAEPGPRPHRLG